MFLVLLMLSKLLHAHDYHFSFLELEYNPTERQFQASLQVTAHDLAYITSKKHGKDFSMEQILRTDSLYNEVSQIILTGFSFYQNNQLVYFKIDGYNQQENGEIIFYLSSELLDRNGTLSIAFPLLSNYFPDQQNKVDFLYLGKHNTLTFLPTDFTKEIYINP